MTEASSKALSMSKGYHSPPGRASLATRRRRRVEQTALTAQTTPSPGSASEPFCFCRHAIRLRLQGLEAVTFFFFFYHRAFNLRLRVPNRYCFRLFFCFAFNILLALSVIIPLFLLLIFLCPLHSQRLCTAHYEEAELSNFHSFLRLVFSATQSVAHLLIHKIMPPSLIFLRKGEMDANSYKSPSVTPELTPSLPFSLTLRYDLRTQKRKKENLPSAVKCCRPRK